MNTFTITIGVYNNARSIIESTHGPYSITIILVPVGTLSGTLTANTSGGIATFANLRILSAGTFSIQASCIDMIIATSVPATVVNYVYTITLATSSTTPSVNFSFTITATLKGEDTNSFTGSCTIALSGTNLAGTLSSTTTTGTASISVYLTTVGVKTITATCPASGSSPAISGSISVTALTEVLSITSFTPIVKFYLAFYKFDCI